MPDFVENGPEVSFIEHRTIEDIRDGLTADFESYMTEKFCLCHRVHCGIGLIQQKQHRICHSGFSA